MSGGGQRSSERRCRGVDSEMLEEWWLRGQILTPLLLASLLWYMAAAVGRGPATAPPWVLPVPGMNVSFASRVCGLGLAAVLLWMFPVRFMRGAFKLLRRRRSRVWRARRPDCWWLADHRWSPVGAAAEVRRPLWSNLARLIGAGRWGHARLCFAWFPFRVGETLAATLRMPVSLRECERVVATLRCVEERWRPGHGLEGGLVAEDVEVQRQVLERDALPASQCMDLTFQLPEGDLGTYLSEHPPRYWELEVEAVRRGAVFASTFLLPVYDLVPHPAQPAPGGIRGAGPELARLAGARTS